MQFESAIKRNWFINLLTSFIPDMILAGIIASLITDTWLATFFFVFLAIELLPLPIWLMRSIYGWVIYLAVGKKAMIKSFLTNLTQCKFPSPNDYEQSSERYFAQIAANKSLSIDIRFAAMSESAAFLILRNLGQLQQLVKINMAYESAIEDYAQLLALTKPEKVDLPA